MADYDILVIGAGPAGLSAASYASRAGYSTAAIDSMGPGGQLLYIDEIENYPGLRTDMEESGLTLTERMTEQVKRFGAERALDEIISFELEGEIKKLTGLSGKVYEARTVILAMGAHYRSIGCRNEDKFRGMGISFCATCDANFFRGLDVYVAGGGDSAIEEAIYLTKFARKVTVIHRRDELRAAKSIQEKAFENEKLSFIWDSVVDEALGEDVLNGLVIRNVRTGELTTIKADPNDGMIGLFGFLGMIPNTDRLEGSDIELMNGYIRADESTRTNIAGVFAAGDIRTKELRQVVTAVSDGATAAYQAEKYLAG